MQKDNSPKKTTNTRKKQPMKQAMDTPAFDNHVPNFADTGDMREFMRDLVAQTSKKRKLLGDGSNGSSDIDYSDLASCVKIGVGKGMSVKVPVTKTGMDLRRYIPAVALHDIVEKSIMLYYRNTIRNGKEPDLTKLKEYVSLLEKTSKMVEEISSSAEKQKNASQQRKQSGKSPKKNSRVFDNVFSDIDEVEGIIDVEDGEDIDEDALMKSLSNVRVKTSNVPGSK